MARRATTTKGKGSAASGRRTAGVTGARAKPATKARRAPSAPAAPEKPAAAKAAPTPKVNTDALRTQLDKLERAHAALRAKSGEAAKAAKAAETRIAELEDRVAALEERLAARDAETDGDEFAPSREARAGAEPRERDPGDAAPPGVAVAEPAPLDAEAEAARDSLEEHLRGVDREGR